MLRITTRFAILVVACASLVGCPLGDGGTAYFLVADPQHPDSGGYVLPLTNPDDIAHARALAWNPQDTDRPLVVARIATGSSDGVYTNRDLLNDRTPWSWHVTEFVGFADFTIELIDGNARLVEDDVDGWITNTSGMIGFWSYTIIRQVWPCEVAATQTPG